MLSQPVLRALRAIFIALSLAGLSCSNSQAAEVTVKVAAYPMAGLAAAKIAEQQGFYKQEGITIDWVTVRTPADGIANLLGGKLDVGFINVGGLAAAAAQNLPLKAFLPLYYSSDDYGIYVRADSPIKTISDLNGKTVGLVQLKNNVHGMVMDSIARGGGNPEAVNFTLIPQANILSALRAGSVDAAQIVEPFIAEGGDAIRPIIPNLFQFSGGSGITAYMVSTKAFATEHAETFIRFMHAYEKGLQYAQANPNAVRASIGEIAEISADTLQKMKLPKFGTDLMLVNAEQQVDLMVKYKLLPTKPDIRPYFE
jgi:NitT/TauT family transport system substrate-binding protein